MSAPFQQSARPEDRPRRAAIALLALLLVAFAIWSSVLFVRVRGLVRGLDRAHAWSVEADAVQRRLTRAGGLSGSADDGSAEALWRALERRPETDLQLAARRALLAETQRRGARDEDTRWEATSAAAAAAADVQAALGRHVAELASRLGATLHGLTVLVLGTLVLAASNLALLLVAHRRRRALEHAHAEALGRAEIDPLTGLRHRGAMLEILGRELSRGTRDGQSVGVVLTEVERFDLVESALTLDQAAAVVRGLSDRMRAQLRPYDVIGRQSEARFLIVLPTCDQAGADAVVQRLEAEVAGRPFPHDGGQQRLHLRSATAAVSPGGTDLTMLLAGLEGRLA